MGVSRILIDFAGWTSAHGIPHVGGAQNNVLRVFWSVIFIVSTGMFISQLVLLIQKFTAFDVTVQTELKFEERSFPAVTLCNLNPFRSSTLARSPDMQSLMKAYQAAVDHDDDDDDAALIAADPQNRWKLKGLKDTVAIQSEAREHLLFITSNLNDQTRKAMSYELEDQGDFASGFVLSCAYNTKPCRVAISYSDFQERDDPVYGKCFTYNYLSIRNSTRAGPLYGLRLLTVSNQEEYLPLTEAAGIRVAIHGHDEEPFIDAFGYNAAAGFTTSFGVKFIQTKRLGQPFGNCTDDREATAYYYQGAYQVEGCFRSCVQQAIVDECDCTEPRAPKRVEGKSYCNVEGPQRKCCDRMNSGNESAGGFNSIEKCACPQPCTESTFGVTVSTALWPSDVYTPPECILDDSNRPWKGKGKPGCKKFYKDNTMLIEVYYERMNYQLLKEYEAYTVVNLISDLGGQLGLWMGISVITIIEFVSLLILLFLYCIHRPEDDQIAADEDEGDINAFDGTKLKSI